MKSICLFSSYFENDTIPEYVKCYLEELLLHFNELLFITNFKKLSGQETNYLKEKGIQVLFVENKGYDFGMWYEAFNNTDYTQYERVGLVNDSCILLKKLDAFFDWANKCNLDYFGMVDSYSRSYHIQSYFLIISKNAIEEVARYFKQIDKLDTIQDVITKYEIGLSLHLSKLNYKLGAFITTKDYAGEFSPAYYLAQQLIQKNIPIIKKRLIFGNYRNEELFTMMRMNINIDGNFYINLIKLRYNNLIIDLDKITANTFGTAYYRKLYWYKVKSLLFQVLRKLKP